MNDERLYAFAVFLIMSVLMTGLTGCATILHGTSDKVYVKSENKEAGIYIDDVLRGQGYVVTEVKRGQKHNIAAKKDGCADMVVRTTEKFDMVSLWGILGYGVPFVVDLINGAAWQLEQNDYVVTPVCNRETSPDKPFKLKFNNRYPVAKAPQTGAALPAGFQGEDAYVDDNQKAGREFIHQFSEQMKKLPRSARIAVPDFKIFIPELAKAGSDAQSEEARKSVINFFGAMTGELQQQMEQAVEKGGLKIVERDAFKEYEKEIMLSQTGEADPKSSARFGKAIGATHIIMGKVSVVGLNLGRMKIDVAAKIVEVETLLRAGSAAVSYDLKMNSE